jgi:serine protease Do
MKTAVFLLLISFTFCLSSEPANVSTLGTLSDSFERLAEKVGPSIVQIFATGYGTDTNPSKASTLLTQRRVSGSGVILDAEGYIVTNAHVVIGARKLHVLLPFIEQRGPGKSILKAKGRTIEARLVGIDAETDLAVLKIQTEPLSFLTLGDSDRLKPGQIVLAFGSPLGLDQSVSMGVVSAVARQLRPEDPMIYIQTDATINPGNSGGPLIDTEGNVVGINTFILSQSGGSEGIGFAAPSNIVKTVYEQIRKNGRVHRGEIGVFAQTITPVMAEALSLPQNWGVILGDVYVRSAAERAGLQVGDIVLSVDGKIVENGRQFDVNLYKRAAQDAVTLEILRGSERKSLTVLVTSREEESNIFAARIHPENNVVPKLGVFCLNMDDELARMIPGLRKQYGVVVAARMTDAPYWTAELRPGDVIHSVNGTLISDLKQLHALVHEMKPGGSVALQIERLGRLSYFVFELE